MTQGRIRTAILMVTLVLVAIIPTMAFILSRNFRTTSSAKSNKYVKPVTTASDSSALVDYSQANLNENGGAAASTSPTTDGASPTPSPEVSFGPTLNFKLKLEARPDSDQSTSLFLGIAQGGISSNPTYLLSFTVDVPTSGEYKGISLAGLGVGTQYTAYLKGKSQISTASAFLMQPAETNLNNNQAVYMVTGDLNEDNVINQADYTIEVSYIGQRTTTANWFPDGDFNKDGVINLIDLAVINRNMAVVGTTGPWQSTPKAPSASLVSPPSVGSPEQVSSPSAKPKGYWLWMPK